MDHSSGKTSFTGAELLTLHEKHTRFVRAASGPGMLYTDWQGMAKDINDYIMGQYAEGYGPLASVKHPKALNRALERRSGREQGGGSQKDFRCCTKLESCWCSGEGK